MQVVLLELEATVGHARTCQLSTSGSGGGAYTPLVSPVKYLAFTVSRALKSCSKVFALNFQSRILVRTDTCRVAMEVKNVASVCAKVCEPFPAAFWRTRSLADPGQ